MSFLNKLSRGVGRAADQAKFEADKLVRVNRLNSEIGDITSQIRDVKVNMADKILQLHKAGEQVPTAVADLILRVGQLEEKMAVSRAQLEAVRAERFEDRRPEMPAQPTPPPTPGVPTGPEPEAEEPDVTDVRAYTEFSQPTVQGRSFPEPGLSGGSSTLPEQSAATKDMAAPAEAGETGCTQCHEPLRPGAKFCAHCGQPVETTE